MMQTSIKRHQKKQRSLQRQLIKSAVLLVAGLFLTILVTGFTPSLRSTAHADAAGDDGGLTVLFARPYRGNVIQNSAERGGNVVEPIDIAGRGATIIEPIGIVGSGSRHVIQEIVTAKSNSGEIEQEITNVFLVCHHMMTS